MSPKLTARDRMTRLLGVIPWVVEHEGASLDEIAARFDYPRDELVKDLTEVVFFVGVHPFTPDSLIEVDITDDHVRIRYADWFSKPLRLRPEEGARLLTAGRSVLALGGGPRTEGDTDAASPLLRALAKLEMALGDAAGDAVDIRLGDAPEAVLDLLRRAVADRTQVELDYYTYGRDELTHRRVDPARVFSDQGQWYLQGWCHRAGGERVFRIDRIRSVTPTDEPVEHALDGAVGSYHPAADDPVVTLRLPAEAGWVVEQYPTRSERVDDDGTLVVELVVSAVPWLERLLLRLGPEAEILDSGGIDPSVASRAAARILARYRG